MTARPEDFDDPYYRDQIRAQLENSPAPARRKYGNELAIADGITFDSKLEAQRYRELALEQRDGRITDLTVHEPIALYAHSPSGPVRIGYLEADFVYRRDGRRTVEDTKSVITRRKPDYRLKAAIFAANNPGEEIVEIVRARRRKPREIA